MPEWTWHIAIEQITANSDPSGDPRTELQKGPEALFRAAGGGSDGSQAVCLQLAPEGQTLGLLQHSHKDGKTYDSCILRASLQSASAPLVLTRPSSKDVKALDHVTDLDDSGTLQLTPLEDSTSHDVFCGLVLSTKAAAFRICLWPDRHAPTAQPPEFDLPSKTFKECGAAREFANAIIEPLWSLAQTNSCLPKKKSLFEKSQGLDEITPLAEGGAESRRMLWLGLSLLTALSKGTSDLKRLAIRVDRERGVATGSDTSAKSFRVSSVAKGADWVVLRAFQLGGLWFLLYLEISANDAQWNLFHGYLDRALQAAKAAYDTFNRAKSSANLQKVTETLNPTFRKDLERLKRAAKSQATILLTGETGVGKELVANWIHWQSGREASRFTVINCSALPESLAAAEIYGAMKGSFTGCLGLPGKLGPSQGGTVFLDELDKSSSEVQYLVLRPLSERTFTMLGAAEPTALHVRFIAAMKTSDVHDGPPILEDLYYRVSVVIVRIPPLRERRDDIPALANQFVAEFCEREKRKKMSVPSNVITFLKKYSWPGNVRELRNVLQEAVVCAEEDATVLGPAHFRKLAQPGPKSANRGPRAKGRARRA